MKLRHVSFALWFATITLGYSDDVKTPQVGEPAPNFRLTTLDGKTFTLAELHGKRVLLNSWASW